MHSSPTWNCRPAGRQSARRAAHFGLILLVLTATVFSLTGCQSSIKTATFPTFRNPFQLDPPPEGPGDPTIGREEYDAAVVLYKAEKYPQAEKAFKKVAKEFKDNPVEEEALFMLAESQFQQKEYPHAQDSYGKLIRKYPSSRYLEQTTRRMFAIGSHWINPGAQRPKEELVQVSAETIKDPVKRTAEKDPYQFPLKPNFLDKSRPYFDTAGRGLKALRDVWINDPTGPLADDALMMTAAYHLRHNNYREADEYLEILRKDYPKSEYTQTAFVVGPHIKLLNYDGARYDGRILNEADSLVRSTINLYPDAPEREELIAELGGIREKAAERDYEKAQLYLRKNKPQAAAVYAELVIKDHPNSSYAGKARQMLAELDPKYRAGFLRSYPTTTPPQETPQTVQPFVEPEQPRRFVPPSGEDVGRVTVSDEDF